MLSSVIDQFRLLPLANPLAELQAM